MSHPRSPDSRRADRLSDQVAAKLQTMVLSTGMQPGDKLPSERELCELLGVSRTVVREALRALAVKGLLDVRQGGGTTVRAPDAALVAEMMTMMLRGGERGVAFSHIQEVRRLLEVEIAGMAAERRGAADLARLEALLEAMRASEHDAPRWAEADVAFHTALAEATQNPLYPVLLGSINDLLLEVRLTGARLPDTAARAYQHHRAIFERVRDQDRSGARRAMQAHLRESEETFQRARVSKIER